MAPHGRRDEALYDLKARDTWEIDRAKTKRSSSRE
jgi:hypothetical protein